MMQLHRLFSAFPAGFPGVGLLLLRVVVAATLGGHGFLCLLSSDRLTPGLLLSTARLLLSGVLLLVGFLTPIHSLFSAVECFASFLCCFPFHLLTRFESKFALGPII